MEGDWVEGEELVDVITQEYYLKQFIGIQNMEEASLLRYIQKSATNEERRRLDDHLSMDEVRKVVFDLNGDSASGLDGFTGNFSNNFGIEA